MRRTSTGVASYLRPAPPCETCVKQPSTALPAAERSKRPRHRREPSVRMVPNAGVKGLGKKGANRVRPLCFVPNGRLSDDFGRNALSVVLQRNDINSRGRQRTGVGARMSASSRAAASTRPAGRQEKTSFRQDPETYGTQGSRNDQDLLKILPKPITR